MCAVMLLMTVGCVVDAALHRLVFWCVFICVLLDMHPQFSHFSGSKFLALCMALLAFSSSLGCPLDTACRTQLRTL